MGLVAGADAGRVGGRVRRERLSRFRGRPGQGRRVHMTEERIRSRRVDHRCLKMFLFFCLYQF